MPASTTPRFRADIQGLRGIAVLAVVGGHALPRFISASIAAIDWFFVISGFVITASLISRSADGERFSLRDFYRRRFWRLAPNLFLMVTVAALATLAMPPLATQQKVAATGLAATFGVSNWQLWALHAPYLGALQSPYRHTWSLGVEEQFYLVLPAVMALGLGLAARRGWSAHRTVATLIGVVLMLSAAYAAHLHISYPEVSNLQVRPYMDTFGRAWEFCVGALVALGVLHWRMGRIPATVLTVLAAAGAGGAALLAPPTSKTPDWPILVAVAMTALALWAGATANPASRLLGWRPLAALGEISYSWYLWHLPFLVLIQLYLPGRQLATLGAVLLSLLVAVLAYRFVEKPLRRRGHSPGRTARGALAALWLTPACATLAVLCISSQGYWNPHIRAANANANNEPSMWGCMSLAELSERDLGDCQVRSGSGTPVYLLGDSNAAQYLPGLSKAVAQLDRPLIDLTMAGCSFNLAPVVRVPPRELRDVRCLEHNHQVVAHLNSAPSGDLFIGTFGRDGLEVGLLNAQGKLATTAAEKETARTRGLRAAVLSLTRRERIWLIRPMPHLAPLGDLNGWQPSRCLPHQVFSDVTHNCSAQRPLAEALQGSEPEWRREQNLTALPGVRTLDLGKEICPSGICRSNNGDSWWYFDRWHLSVAGSTRLAPRFVAALREGQGSG